MAKNHPQLAIAPNRWIPRPEVRAWIYGIAVAGAALLVGYGVLTIEQGGLWLAVIGAVLGTSNLLAARNVSTITVHEEPPGPRRTGTGL